MGQRTAGETLARILAAFVQQRVWSQADLARKCGVSVKAVRSRLTELSAAGFPLHSESDPPHVYWSFPRNWHPNGRLLGPNDVRLVTRMLNRLPRSAAQAQALCAVLGVRDGQLPLVEDDPYAAILATLEDAAEQRKTARVLYFTASRAEHEDRELSIHRILYGDGRVRFIATCHRTDTLKYFRLEQTKTATLSSTPFRPAPQNQIDRFLDESLDGFRAPGPAIRCSFVVTYPDASWVRRNLPPGPIAAEPFERGIRFTTHTAGIDVLARFVVGLGSSAWAETPELRRGVRALARGALEQLNPGYVNTRPVGPKRATKQRRGQPAQWGR